MFCSETSKRVVEDVCNVALVKSVCGTANACVRGDLLGVCLCGLSVRIHVFLYCSCCVARVHCHPLFTVAVFGEAGLCCVVSAPSDVPRHKRLHIVG